MQADQSTTLAWDPNPEPDLAGYRLHYGPASGTYTNAIDVGNVTTNTVTNLVNNADYFFVVTAYNSSGLESDPSNEVSYHVPANSLEAWRSRHFTATDLADPAKETTVWGDKADPDQDGRDNLLEFALALDPTKREGSQLGVVSSVVDVAGQKHQTLTFTRRKNEPLLQYLPEVSGDNQTWQTGPAHLLEQGITDLSADYEVVTVQDIAIVEPGQPRFIRLTVVRNDM